jgi:hypothetical protein
MEPGSSLQPTQWVGRGGGVLPARSICSLTWESGGSNQSTPASFYSTFPFLFFSSLLPPPSPCHSRSLFPKHTAAGSGSRGLGFGFWVRIPNPESPAAASQPPLLCILLPVQRRQGWAGLVSGEYIHIFIHKQMKHKTRVRPGRDFDCPSRDPQCFQVQPVTCMFTSLSCFSS